MAAEGNARYHAAYAKPPATPYDPAFFDACFDRALALLNFNFYHATPSDCAAGKLGCGSHTDYGMLTLLATDAVPGLQVCRDKSKPAGDREWIDVSPPPSDLAFLVVNVGDMLEHWTNGHYVSNLHRVVNATGKERVSAAFFFEPNANARITPLLKSGVDQATTALWQTRGEGGNGGEGGQGGESKYGEVVYGDWLAMKFRDSGEVA